jgi:tRNA A-37 threonylcarbamoyl transferase component Bud32
MLGLGFSADCGTVVRMRRLPRGYTNRTASDGSVVVKVYAGPDAALRAEREYRALEMVRGRVPVPPVLQRTPDGLILGYVAGSHGQDLLVSGYAEPVLTSCGSVLRDIHDAGVGHGDFGPHNVLLDAATFDPVAVLDWEFAIIPLADHIADLAWCEWIVRTHHRTHTAAIPALFDAYGSRPLWRQRHAAMLTRCRELMAFGHRWEPGGAVERSWRSHLGATTRWQEIPGRR